jgi:hypothetical protein
MKKEQHFQSTTLSTQSKGTKKITLKKSQAIKDLESLIFEAKRIKYPSIPPEYLAPVKYRDDSANGLTKCIIDFLRIKGHQAERISSTGRPIDRQTTFADVIGRIRTIGRIEWIPGSGSNGSADISGTIKGWSVKLEVKINDRQSQAQKDYERSIIQAGGLYVIVRSFAQFLTWYKLNFGSNE